MICTSQYSLARHRIFWVLVLDIIFLLVAGPVSSASFESFLEPAHQVDLVPATREVIQKIFVKEGDRVTKAQLLVSLNTAILQARLQAATILGEAHGKIDSARIVEKMRQDQLEDLQRLATSGNVRMKELDRAKADLAIAQAELLAMQEEHRIRMAEVQQIKAQIAEKEIRSPIAGVVTYLSKEEGELTGTSDQDILVTVVQEHPLQAIFHLPIPTAASLSLGQILPIKADLVAQTVGGRVEFISPVTNPESGTIKVKVILQDDRTFQAGLRCFLSLAEPAGNSVKGQP